MDDVLDLVAAAQRHALCAQVVGFLGAATTAALAASATARTTARLCAFLLVRGIGGGFVAIAAIRFLVADVVLAFVVAVLDVAGFDRRNLVRFRSVNFGQTAIEIFVFVIIVKVAVVRIVAVVFSVLRSAKCGLFFGMRGFFGEQCIAIRLGNLVVVRVNFAEGEETVPVASEIDECRLKRGLYARYLGEVDVALDLLLVGRFEIELFNAVALEYRHPRLFRVARIHKHARCHLIVSRRQADRLEPVGRRQCVCGCRAGRPRRGRTDRGRLCAWGHGTKCPRLLRSCLRSHDFSACA